MERGVFVLGMHRSGSSAATRLINLLGVPTCVEDDLLPPNDENRRVYWESASLASFNDRLLASLGGDWSAPPPLDPGWAQSPSLEEARANARHAFARVFPANRWVWKDPRNCLLLPFWLECLDVRPVMVLVLRDPIEIAGSLRSCGLSGPYALALWERYLRATLEGVAGRRVMVCSYEELLADPVEWCGRVSEFLRESGFAIGRVAKESIVGFVEPARRHAVPRNHEVAIRSSATDEQKQLLLALEGLRGVHESFDAGVLPSESLLTDALLAERRRAIAHEKELADHLGTLEARSTGLKAELSADDHTLQIDRTELAAVKQALDVQSGELASSRAREQRLSLELDSTRRRERGLERRIAEVSGELQLVLGSRGWRILEHARRLLIPRHVSDDAMPTIAVRHPVWQRMIRQIRPFVPKPIRKSIARTLPRIEEIARNASRETRTLEKMTSGDVFTAQFPQLRPLALFPTVSHTRTRLTVVTDSLSSGSLFGGVGTALIFATVLARRIDASLRVITRSERPEPTGFSRVLSAASVDWPEDVEFLQSAFDGSSSFPVGGSDLLLTTSWWNTWAALESLDPSKIIYLLQEDERLFYPAGDERLLCAEVLSHPKLQFAVNTMLLYEHLVAEGFRSVEKNGVVFEPAFPDNVYFPAPRGDSPRKKFFFYARPHNRRNLFVRGLQVVNEAVASEILDPDEWDFAFVGKDIPPISLSGGVIPRRFESIPWTQYVELVRTVDVGLSLIDTPHPGYPPLDLAACGSIAVTNRFGVKRSLDCYSENILCADLDAESLRRTIVTAVNLARDDARRAANYRSQRLSRSWAKSLGPAVERLAEEL